MATIDLTKERDQSPSPRRRESKRQPEIELPGSIRVIVTAQNHASCFQHTFPARHLPQTIQTLLKRSPHVINITLELVKARDNFPYHGNKPVYSLQERMDILGWLQSLGYTPDFGFPEGTTKYAPVPLPPGLEDLANWNEHQPTFQTLSEGPVHIVNFMTEDDAGADAE